MRTSRPLSTLAWGFAVLAAAFLAPAALAAQVVPEAVAWARYNRAQEDFMELAREAETLQTEVARLARILESHREVGNLRAAGDVFATDYHPQAMRLQTLNSRSVDAKAMLDEARRDLLRTLRTREDELLAELERAPAPIREEEINRQVTQIRREVAQLEREREPIAEVGFRPVPPLPAAETDGPADLLAKARFLERIAESYFGIIEFVDDEIRTREGALRLQRSFDDTRDGIGRFDGDRAPGTGPVVRPPGTQVADERAGDAENGDIVFAELPLGEQVEQLRSVRMQAEDAREDALAQAAELRRIAAQLGGGDGW